ncbi:MAG TPA: hypothetical protein VFE62_20575 [Gemmataceae bacterium]|nr:hypothetical protein [Gemmataceae bacterium]
MGNQPFYSVGEVAHQLGVEPRVLSDLFYLRKLSNERCRVFSGRRLIPADYVDEIRTIVAAHQAESSAAASIAG